MMRGAGVIFVLLLAVVAIGASVWFEYATVDYEYATVRRDAERECHTSSSSDGGSSTSCHWKVYTENEVFKLTDNILFFQFASADIANQLRPGQSYCLKVNGWRIPFLSAFRKIIRIEGDTFQCGVPR